MSEAVNHVFVCELDGAEVRFLPEGGVGPLSLRVYGGEILGVAGRNGAGKTTLLRLMAGILKPAAGICWRHESLAGRIAYVPQEMALYAEFTGVENMRFWGRVWGLGGQVLEQRCRWLLEQMELTAKGGVEVAAYSSGMQRRLHLATAIMATPGLLLLDEPTAGADEHSAGLVLETVERLRDKGCAVVLASRRSEELARLCDRGITLEGGRISDTWEKKP